MSLRIIKFILNSLLTLLIDYGTKIDNDNSDFL